MVFVSGDNGLSHLEVSVGVVTMYVSEKPHSWSADTHGEMRRRPVSISFL